MILSFSMLVLTPETRSYDLNRMDCIKRMASTTNHTVSESQPRPSYLRVPLRLRVFRGHEGVQRQEGADKTISAR